MSQCGWLKAHASTRPRGTRWTSNGNMIGCHSLSLNSAKHLKLILSMVISFTFISDLKCENCYPFMNTNDCIFMAVLYIFDLHFHFVY